MIGRLQQIFIALNDHNVDFVLCGGVACVLQGCERTTQDLDLYISLEQANLMRAVEAFRSLDLQPRIPEPIESLADEHQRSRWIQEKNALVYTLVSPEGLFQVDVFLTYPVSWQQLRDHADTMTVAETPILVSSRDDLIAAKQQVQPPREKDLWDIRVLKELQNNA